MIVGRRLAKRSTLSDFVCLLCRVRISSSGPRVKDRAFSAPVRSYEESNIKLPPRPIFRRAYFSANGFLDELRNEVQRSAWESSNFDKQAEHGASENPPKPPDRPSLRLKHNGNKVLPLENNNRGQVYDAKTLSAIDSTIPPDASSRLTTISTSLPPSSLRRLFMTYLSLSKPRLSFLIVLTTAATYSIYPVPAVLLSSTTVAPSLSALTLVFLTGGSALCTASANALNMLIEPEHDAKMSRTRNRPLVRGLISKKGALIFAGISGIIGVGGLCFGVNPTVAFLGGLNIALYAGVYTPMKRISVVNTWIGAIVGGIPPLMGWAAAAGQSATGSGGWHELLLGEENIGGWLLAALLFAWQFPHFNALSWPIREEYKNAGYRMLVWTNARMNGRVAFRYSLLLFPICFGLTWYGVTDRGFLVTSSIVNIWIVREAWRFWRREGLKGSARGLFWASVWHLPVIMVLAMAHKKGLWEGVWRRVVGDNIDDGMWISEDISEDEAYIDDRRESKAESQSGHAVSVT